jgi:hypothetical protein
MEALPSLRDFLILRALDPALKGVLPKGLEASGMAS